MHRDHPLRSPLPLDLKAKSLAPAAPSRLDLRGVSRSSRTLRRDAMDAACAMTKRATRTAKPCGPDAPTLASNSRRRVPRLAGDGGNKARSPRRARSKPLKPLRRECRVDPAHLWRLPRVLFSLAREAAGATDTRHSLRPLFEGRTCALILRVAPHALSFGQTPLARPGRTAPRETPTHVPPQTFHNRGSGAASRRRERVDSIARVARSTQAL